VNSLVRLDDTALQASDAFLDQLVSGLRVDRVEMRRLMKKLEKFRGESLLSGQPIAPGLECALAQLRGALAMRGWKHKWIVAQSAESLRQSGLTVGEAYE